MVFIAIVVPVTIQGITLANRAGIVADRKLVAGRLAENILSEAIITEAWLDGNQQGEFAAEDWPGYSWTLTTDAWAVDALRTVTVTVFFTVQNRDYSIQLTTLAEELPSE